MPFIPHTDADVTAMLKTIGARSIEDCFDEIPKNIPVADLSQLPEGLDEYQVTRLMTVRAPQSQYGTCFIGAGAYEHHIPAAVWEVVTRGEFYTAYTPYQPEVSQGTLQVIYEYQSMMTALMAMEVSNASLYDGATALVEAVLMALRIQKNKKTNILVPTNLHPNYRAVLRTILQHHEVTLIDWRYDAKTGLLDQSQLEKISLDTVTAVIIAQPNFFGGIESVDAITNLAHQKNALVIGVVNPIAMALLTPPGEWGDVGADIACGEGQPLGVPLAGGGPYFGFLCCRMRDIRQMPGRLVGRTKDANGKVGFVLTLQAREQHIRRAKATSNICTNQGLLVTAATIYMRLLGAKGLHDVALRSHQQAMQLKSMLSKIAGVSIVFNAPQFHEFVVRFDQPIEHVLEKMRAQGLQAGFSLQHIYPELKNCLLICVTETKTADDLQRFLDILL